MVERPLVTVHWEDSDTTSRGLDPTNSIKFLENYRRYLSPRAASAFVLQQTVFSLLRVHRRKEALLLLRRHSNFAHLRLLDVILLASLIVFADDRIPRTLVAAKDAIRHRI
jgi:hypothetical protein